MNKRNIWLAKVSQLVYLPTRLLESCLMLQLCDGRLLLIFGSLAFAGFLVAFDAVGDLVNIHRHLVQFIGVAITVGHLVSHKAAQQWIVLQSGSWFVGSAHCFSGYGIGGHQGITAQRPPQGSPTPRSHTQV